MYGGFGIAAIILFAIALIFQVANVATTGHVFTAISFALAGLLCLAVHVTGGWWSTRTRV